MAKQRLLLDHEIDYHESMLHITNVKLLGCHLKVFLKAHTLDSELTKNKPDALFGN